MSAYTGWTLRSSNGWSRLQDELRERTGLDVCFQRPGGLSLCLSEREMETRAATIKQIHSQEGAAKYEVALLSRGEIEKMLPELGPDVAAGSHCPLDGM